MKVQKQRRRQNRTDYLKRLKLLKSEKPRIVFRKTNRYMIAQYVESHEAQDKIVFGMDSRELLKYGVDKKVKSLKNITVAYLFGFLFGKTIQKKKLETPIVDFGMIQTLHKTKVYAFLKGLIESGVEINCKEEAFPDEERIKGEHLKNKIDFAKVKSALEKL